jgi:hypothetical protein
MNKRLLFTIKAGTKIPEPDSISLDDGARKAFLAF